MNKDNGDGGTLQCFAPCSYQDRLTTDKRFGYTLLKLPSATSFIDKPLGDISEVYQDV